MCELTAAFHGGRPVVRPRAVPIGAHQSGKPSLNVQVDANAFCTKRGVALCRWRKTRPLARAAQTDSGWKLLTRENPARIAPGGRCCRRRSVAVGPAAARPDQAEGLAAFVVEQVGVDRRGEARIVELDREVIAVLAGALRPRGTNLRAADKDPVAW